MLPMSTFHPHILAKHPSLCLDYRLDLADRWRPVGVGSAPSAIRTRSNWFCVCWRSPTTSFMSDRLLMRTPNGLRLGVRCYLRFSH